MISLALVLGANALVFWSLADAAAGGHISSAPTIVFLTAMVGTSMIAFGGWSWALDGAAAPVAALNRLEPAMAAAGALPVAGDAAAGHAACRRARSGSAT